MTDPVVSTMQDAQLTIASLLRHGQGRRPAEIGALFGRWDEGRLKSYLVEITAAVLSPGPPPTRVTPANSDGSMVTARLRSVDILTEDIVRDHRPSQVT